MIKLVITDLDDTLYSWIGFFIPAFYDMVQELCLMQNLVVQMRYMSPSISRQSHQYMLLIIILD